MFISGVPHPTDGAQERAPKGAPRPRAHQRRALPRQRPSDSDGPVTQARMHRVRTQEASGWIAVPIEDAHPVHRLRCRSLHIAVLQDLSHRARFLRWRGKRCWGRFSVSRGAEHGCCVDRVIARYCACAMDGSTQTRRGSVPLVLLAWYGAGWTGVPRLGVGPSP